MTHKHTPLTLEQHQQILYEILYMVDDFCKEHNIKYFLVGGSLLGAVRHQGIIPWDDDIDIAMIRDEYERFIELFNEFPPKGYRILYYNNCNYFLPFVKMEKVGTESIDKGFWMKGKEVGTAIDIFPYDGCPGNIEQAQDYFMSLNQKIKFMASWRFHIPFKGILRLGTNAMILKAYIKCPTKSCYAKLLNQITRYKCQETKYSACIAWGVYGKGEVQLSEGFLKTDKMLFGERYLPVPLCFHEYLTGLYGDYMKLPPESKRVSKHLNSTTLH